MPPTEKGPLVISTVLVKLVWIHSSGALLLLTDNGPFQEGVTVLLVGVGRVRVTGVMIFPHHAVDISSSCLDVSSSSLQKLSWGSS